MPELPEVETVRRGLAPRLEGRAIARVIQRRADIRKALPVRFVHDLEGRRIQAVERRAKYLLVRLSGRLVLLVHLGMTGRLFLQKRGSEREKHDHIVFELDHDLDLVFNDARRFGHVDLIGENELAAYPGLRDLGPEPLDRGFTGKVLFAALQRRKSPVKLALMDQKLVAGLGNIYVCEALYRSRIDPRRQATSLTEDEASALARAIKAVLRDAIGSGGSTLRDYVNSDRESGRFQHQFDVYGREGKPCRRCKGNVARIVQGGRSTFHCPCCQS